MSMDPGMMSQMLAQKLAQPAQAGTAGGGQGGPQMQGSVSPENAAATLVQKAMLIRALNGQPSPQQMMQQRQANAMLPQTNAMVQGQMPAMASGINPNLPPPPGVPPPGNS